MARKCPIQLKRRKFPDEHTGRLPDLDAVVVRDGEKVAIGREFGRIDGCVEGNVVQDCAFAEVD